MVGVKEREYGFYFDFSFLTVSEKDPENGKFFDPSKLLQRTFNDNWEQYVIITSVIVLCSNQGHPVRRRYLK